MKQTIIAVICFLCVSSLYIQAQKINHPSLLYTPQRIQQVKQRMQHEPKLQEAWGDIKKTADEALQKKDFNRLDYLSLAYLMTDNKEYADAIKEILLKAVEAESWGDVEMMAWLRKPCYALLPEKSSATKHDRHHIRECWRWLQNVAGNPMRGKSKSS